LGVFDSWAIKAFDTVDNPDKCGINT